MIDFGLIVLIMNMVIFRSYTIPTYFLSVNIGGLVSLSGFQSSQEALKSTE